MIMSRLSVFAGRAFMVSVIALLFLYMCGFLYEAMLFHDWVRVIDALIVAVLLGWFVSGIIEMMCHKN